MVIRITTEAALLRFSRFKRFDKISRAASTSTVQFGTPILLKIHNAEE